MGSVCSYVDVSTVDVATSKLISTHIKSTGALFLEVSFEVSIPVRMENT